MRNVLIKHKCNEEVIVDYGTMIEGHSLKLGQRAIGGNGNVGSSSSINYQNKERVNSSSLSSARSGEREKATPSIDPS